jgi:hypothetical protein
MSYYQQPYRPVPITPIATDNIINNIHFNIKTMRNIFRKYIDKYNYFLQNKYLNNEFINELDKDDKDKLVKELLGFNMRLTAFINLNNPSQISQPPVMIPQQPQSSFLSFYGGKKSKYTKTKLSHSIGNKKYTIYLGSRGAKYIKKNKKYINIKAL